jgi:putative peptidoglycan lipid II flippase
MKSPRKKIAKAAGVLVGLQVFEQITGIVKQAVIAAQFGTSARMDTYVVATTVVGLILLWIGLPIRQTLIPMFRHELARRGEQAAWGSIAVLLNTLAVGLVAIVVVAELLAPWIVALLAPGFDAGMIGMGTSLARITILSVVFMGLAELLAQILFSYERFARPGIVGSVNNLVVIGTLLAVGFAWGIHGLAVAVVLGALGQFLIQVPILWEKRRFYRWRVDLRDPNVAEMGRLSVPLLLSTSGTEVSRITDRIFASLLPRGSLSALAYAHRPMTVLFDFMIRPLQQATFPHFSRLTAEGDYATLSRQLFQYLRLIFFFALPVAVGFMVAGPVLVRVLFQRGSFDETSVALTSGALAFYALGFPAHAIMRVLRRTYFSMKDTWTPTKIALGCIGLKVLLSWFLIGPLAHLGIALAESLSQTANAVLLFVFLPREIKGHEGAKTLVSFGQTAAMGGVIALLLYVAKEAVDGRVSPPLELVSLAVVGAAVYATFALVFQGEASRSVLKTLTAFAPFRPKKS